MYKDYHQNISIQNSATCKKDYTPQPSGIYPGNARLAGTGHFSKENTQ